MSTIAIIIAPRAISDQLRKHLAAPAQVYCFDHLDEFDRWRQPEPRSPLASETTSAMWQLSCESKSLPHLVWEALERLKASSQVDLPGFLPETSLRRTFYRRWREIFPETPAQFLQRVRVQQTLRLIHRDRLNPKGAAIRAGFASAAEFRRTMVRLQSRSYAWR